MDAFLVSTGIVALAEIGDFAVLDIDTLLGAGARFGFQAQLGAALSLPPLAQTTSREGSCRERPPVT